MELSIIIPTYNERENLPLLVEGILEVMGERPVEIIVVDDDSEDGTWRVAQELSFRHPNMHVIRRIHRRGLSSAVVEGLLLGKGTYLAVLDADLQHDIRLIPRMLDEIEGVDMVIGSRYVHQKTIPGWNRWRLGVSQLGTSLARRVASARSRIAHGPGSA